MTQTHAPTPYRIEERRMHSADGYAVAVFGMGETESTKQFVLRACNTHGEAVSQLRSNRLMLHAFAAARVNMGFGEPHAELAREILATEAILARMTGDAPATRACLKCGSPLLAEGWCSDDACPLSDWPQSFFGTDVLNGAPVDEGVGKLKRDRHAVPSLMDEAREVLRQLTDSARHCEGRPMPRDMEAARALLAKMGG